MIINIGKIFFTFLAVVAISFAVIKTAAYLNINYFIDDTGTFTVCTYGCDKYVCENVKPDLENFKCMNPMNFNDKESAKAYFYANKLSNNSNLVNPLCLDQKPITYKNAQFLTGLSFYLKLHFR